MLRIVYALYSRLLGSCALCAARPVLPPLLVVQACVVLVNACSCSGSFHWHPPLSDTALPVLPPDSLR